MKADLIPLVFLGVLLGGCTSSENASGSDQIHDPARVDALFLEGHGSIAQVSWIHEDNSSMEYDITVQWSWPELDRGQLRAAAMFFEVPGNSTWQRVANKPILVSATDDLGGVAVGASVFGVGASQFVDEPTGATSDSAPTNTVSTSGPLAFDEKRWKLQGINPAYPVTVHFVVFGSLPSDLEVTVEFDKALNASVEIVEEDEFVVVHPTDIEGQTSVQAGAFAAMDSSWTGAPNSGTDALWAARWPVPDGEGQRVRVQDPVNPPVELDRYLGWVGYSPIVGAWQLDIEEGISQTQFDQPFLLIMPLPETAQ